MVILDGIVMGPTVSFIYNTIIIDDIYILTSIVLFLDAFLIFKMLVVVHSALIMSFNLDPNAV
jgi:hypothetical protein